MIDNQLGVRTADVQLYAPYSSFCNRAPGISWSLCHVVGLQQGTVESHPCSSLGCGRRDSWPKQPRRSKKERMVYRSRLQHKCKLPFALRSLKRYVDPNLKPEATTLA